MTEAGKLFNETFGRWLFAMSVVSNFRSTFTAVASSASEHLQAVNTDLVRSLFEDLVWTGFLVDVKTEGAAQPKPTASDYTNLGKVAARGIFDTSYASLDGAVLVFCHSLLDGLVFDCCRVTALHAPRDWEQDLKSTQVQLLETKSKSYDQLLQVKLHERLERLERESLLTKLERLFAKCNPPSGWSPMVGYVFDKERVQAIR